jgi:hypothetical protein
MANGTIQSIKNVQVNSGRALNRIKGYNNTAVGRAGVEPGGGGAVYCGGWGDVDIIDSLFYGNTADEGGAIYGHIHTNATRPKTTRVINTIAFGNIITGEDSGRGGSGMLFGTTNIAFDHYVEVEDSISWNDGLDEICGIGTASNLILSVSNSNVRGGEAATTWIDLYTDNIDTDAFLVELPPLGPLGIDATVVSGTTLADLVIKAPLGPEFQAIPEFTNNASVTLNTLVPTGKLFIGAKALLVYGDDLSEANAARATRYVGPAL